MLVLKFYLVCVLLIHTFSILIPLSDKNCVVVDTEHGARVPERCQNSKKNKAKFGVFVSNKHLDVSPI